MPGRRPRLSKATKLRWFTRGATALGIAAPRLVASGYCCPLCLCISTGIDDFTVEDVPPFSVGGRPLLLTCKKCNDIGGHDIDKHWAKFAAFQGFAAGEPVSLAAKMILGGVSTTIEMKKQATIVQVRVVQKASSPAAVATQLEAWKAAQGDFGVGLSFPKNRYNIAKVRASVLRAAYLTGFAVLGYRYLRAWAPIRDAVLSSAGAPHGPLVTFDLAGPLDRRVIGVVTEPEIYNALLIGMGGWTVLLPLRNPTPLYESITQEQAVSFTVHTGDWPKEPTFGLRGDLL